MSYPHPPLNGGAQPVSSTTSALIRSARPETRALRPATRTRRYEISWLNADGLPETTMRLAPAVPAFEDAFSAFARGTLILTETGHVAVEDLEPGMRIVTAAGRTEVLAWIGSITLYPARAMPEVAATPLTRLTTDALGQGRPMPDLLLGPGARVLVRDPRCLLATGADGAYLPAAGFIDGETVIEVNPVSPVTVYHLALRRHASVRAAGVEMEAYHPGLALPEGLDPQYAGLFLSLFPHLRSLSEFGPLAHPRLSLRDFDLIRAA